MHGQGRLVNLQQRQGFRTFRISHGTTQHQIFNTGDLDDIAGVAFFQFNLVQALVTEYLTNLGLDRGALVFGGFFFGTEHDQHVLTGLDLATIDLADADATDVGRVIERRNLQLERCVDVGIRGRHVAKNRVEQRNHVFARLIEFHGRPAIEAGSVNDGEIELFVGRTELVEQVEGQIDSAIRICTIAVNLVDQHDWAQA